MITENPQERFDGNIIFNHKEIQLETLDVRVGETNLSLFLVMSKTAYTTASQPTNPLKTHSRILDVTKSANMPSIIVTPESAYQSPSVSGFVDQLEEIAKANTSGSLIVTSTALAKTGEVFAGDCLQ